MTPQMARGSQVAFCNSWLERQNIESQTVDVHSHIDGSLSYEENIKKMKRMLGMGGRSTQQATSTMTAGECDVAIGNYEAGYNGTTMKDACECGHPDACEELERKKAKPKKTTPKRKAAIEQIELRTGRKYPRTKKELETHWGWSIEITRGTKTFLGESKPQVTIYAKGGIKRHPGIGTNTALAIWDFCNKNKIPTIAERTKAAARAVPPASPKKTPTPKAKPKAAATPKFKTTEDAEQWLEKNHDPTNSSHHRRTNNIGDDGVLDDARTSRRITDRT